jgi:hypothetical protein
VPKLFVPICNVVCHALSNVQSQAGPIDAMPTWTLDQIAGLAFGVSSSSDHTTKAGAAAAASYKSYASEAGLWPA